MLPLVFPPIALGYALLQLLGRYSLVGGFLESYFGIRFVFSQAGVILAAFVVGLPLVVRPLEAALAGGASIHRLGSFSTDSRCGITESRTGKKLFLQWNRTSQISS